MNTNQKIAIGMFIAALLTLVWLFRWDTVGPAENGLIFKTDRWTGDIWWCGYLVGDCEVIGVRR